MKKKVEILLATYNGEKFLEEQLRSIADQDFSDFKVLVSDGGSTDGTLEILKRWTSKDNRFEILPPKGRLKAKNNFSYLMESSQGDYLFFADQDDFWKKEKLSIFLKEMERLEVIHGEKTPLLIHSDLEIVDENLKRISPSFWQFACIHGKEGSIFSRLLLQNTVTGAACLINRTLLKLTGPIPEEAVMHDWWLALTAGAFGTIGVIEKQTVLYRQHGKNEIGAKRYISWRLIKFGLSLLLKKKNPGRGPIILAQAKAFAKRFDQQLSLEKQKILSAYFTLRQSSIPLSKRTALVNEHQLYYSGFLRNVAFICFHRQ